MTDGGITVTEFEAKPCGHVHAHLSEMLACLERNGNPGLREVERTDD